MPGPFRTDKPLRAARDRLGSCSLRMAIGRWIVRRGVPFAFPFFNPLARIVLRLPSAHSALSGRVIVMRFRGRRSSARYAVPIAYRRADDGALEAVTSAYGVWWRNLEGGAPVSVLYRGRLLPARVEVVRAEAENSGGEAADAIQRGLDARDPVRRALVLAAPHETVLLRVWVDEGEGGGSPQADGGEGAMQVGEDAGGGGRSSETADD